MSRPAFDDDDNVGVSPVYRVTNVHDDDKVSVVQKVFQRPPATIATLDDDDNNNNNNKKQKKEKTRRLLSAPITPPSERNSDDLKPVFLKHSVRREQKKLKKQDEDDGTAQQQQQQQQQQPFFLYAAPPIDDDDDDDEAERESNKRTTTTNAQQQLHSEPQALRGSVVPASRRGYVGVGASSSSLVSVASNDQGMTIDSSDLSPSPPQQQQHHRHQQQQQHQASLLIVANAIQEEDIRRQYLSQARDEILGVPVQAKAVVESKHSRLRMMWICVVVIIVVVTVTVVVVIVKARNNGKGGGAAASPPSSTPTDASQRETCERMTEVLNSNSNWTLLMMNVSDDAVSPFCDSVGNSINGEKMLCTYYDDAGSEDADILQASNALCSQLGGTLIQEEFSIRCNNNSSVQNNTARTDLSFVANFRRNFVCVGTTCNASQVESYLNARIASKTQRLEKEGKDNCEVLFATYNYQNTSQQQQQQQVSFLPSVWGEQCAAEYDAIVHNNNSAQWFNTTIALPRCQRNGTDASCTVDLTFEAISQTEPWCKGIGGVFLTIDVQFHCNSLHGGTYTIKYVNQPACTGASCDVSQVRLYTSDLIRSSLVHQGYRNCQLLSSSSLHQKNVSEQQLNESLTSSTGQTTCAAATAMLSSNPNLAALYAAVSSSSSATTSAPTNDFSSQPKDARNLCEQLQGNYVEEDFTIGCDSFYMPSKNVSGTDYYYVYNFLRVFRCLGSMCNVSEIESYLEWPIVSQTQMLENAGRGRNCQALYGRYNLHSADDGGVEADQYLPSIWGEKCAAENNVLLSSNTNISGVSPPIWACQRNGQRQANCTTDYSGENALVVQSSCQLLGGQYFEVDFTFTCASQVGNSDTTTYILDFLHFPRCIGISCNLNQSAAATLQTTKLNLESVTEGLRNCQLFLPFQVELYHPNASVQQQQTNNVSAENCTWQTNHLNANSDWSELNSRSSQSAVETCPNNGRNCTIDFSIILAHAKSLCNETLGGQLAEVNFTLGNCIQSGSILTYNYVHDFFCLGLSCNENQVNNYLVGGILQSKLRNYCQSP